MIAHLAAVAQRLGITVFSAEVMPANHRMVQVFRDSGFPVDVRAVDGAIEIEFATTMSDEARARFEDRERVAAVAAVKSFLNPRSVAVIGASRRRGTVGAEVLHNVLEANFTGPVYAINPKADSVQGQLAYASVADLPEPAELAVIAVPASAVNDVARACGAAGVHALLVISAGFGEAGEAGEQRQNELLGICRETGMRLVGPNCFGVLNTDPEVQLNVTFATNAPPPGNVGFFSQSGGLGIAMIEASKQLGLGLSSFVSVGNKADVSGNDLLDYWEQDPGTKVILFYLESFGNPRRFARIGRRVSATKPIIAVKSGRSPAGARATSSHTGALLSASDVTVDALFRQAGVIRTDTMHELFDVAALLAAQPVPRGARVAIVTNGGGPGILCADACQASGLDVVEFSDQVRAELAAVLPAEASVANPIDMIATAPAAAYRRVLEILIAHDACDAIITIFVPALNTVEQDVAGAVTAAAQDDGQMTIASVFMGETPPTADVADARAPHIPRFDFPEDAARAVSCAARYSEWRRRPLGTVTVPADCQPDKAAAVIAESLAAGGGWLEPQALINLLHCYELPLVPTRIVGNAEEAVSAAAAFGGPVVLKAIADDLVHKTEAGGVVLGLEGADAVRAGALRIKASMARSGHTLTGLIVQPMLASGFELLVGVVHDETFGPLIAAGAGGTSAELLRDVAVRITPLSDLDAGEMLRSLRSFPLLQGYRGAPACDLGAIEDLLLRLNALVETHPEIAELDFNPVVARPDGATILDARIRVQAAPISRPPFSLRS